MLISQLGEFGLIERFKKVIPLDKTVIKGPGDDCAVIAYNKDSYLLMTCDMIIEGVDFTPRDDPYLIGRKALAVCVSDIAACGGLPHYALVSMGLKATAQAGYVDKLLAGMLSIAKKFRINIVGGDLSRASCLTIDVSMTGAVEKKNLVLRSGARNNDTICVTGKLGGSLYGKHLSFTPRLKESRLLVQNYKPSAMIDISDGLVQDLGHLLKASGKGAVLYEDCIPVSSQARSLKQALAMGEDFELLFTLSGQKSKQLLRRHKGFFPIGTIVDQAQGVSLVDARGRRKSLTQTGFRHF
jgi:thiamine-monophosphate kinase